MNRTDPKDPLSRFIIARNERDNAELNERYDPEYQDAMKRTGQSLRYFGPQRERRIKRSISPFQRVCGVTGFVLFLALCYVVICLVLGYGN